MNTSTAVLQAFRRQVEDCRQLGSPFTGAVLDILATDLAKGGGAVAALIGAWPGDPVADALPIRLAGAFHVLVLNGQAPALAACYPPAVTTADMPRLTTAIHNSIEHHYTALNAYIAHPPQTNETLRSAVLLGGFTTLAAEFGLPLRLLEIGASAGLNSIWDKYRYQLGETVIGASDSPVLLATDWRGPLPPLAWPQISSRAACDRSPVDLTDPARQLRLRSYVWADQRVRLARLEGAIAVALASGVTVEQADAGDWITRELHALPTDAVTVIYHSVMWQYMPAETQQRIRHSMEQAGRGGKLAWLRFEPGAANAPFELRLTVWRKGEGQERLLATAHPHGASVNWRAT